MMTKRTSLLLMLMCGGLVGCQGGDLCIPCIEAAKGAEETPMEAVTGTIHLLQDRPLSPDALVIVKLADVSLQDVAATTVAQQVIQPGDMRAPFPFELKYDPTKIDPRNTYAVGVRIEDDGKLVFVNTQAYHVITRHAPTQLDVTVDPVK